MKAVSQKGGGVCIAVRVQPRSSKSGIAGLYADSIKVSIRSAPVDDAANAECCDFFARLLGVPRSRVAVASGRSSRNKLLMVDGIALPEAEAILAPLVGLPKEGAP